MLGRIMEDHDGIAVAGTHGKTTVCAMTSFLLRACGLDPSFVIGGVVSDLGGVGGFHGRGGHLVIEACEYDRSFLSLGPRYIVITNIEEDHLDYYDDLDDLRGAFSDFVGRLERRGDLIVWDDVPDVESLVTRDDANLLTYGFSESAAFRAVDLEPDRTGTTFNLLLRGDSLGTFRISQTGRHSVLNATAALAVALPVLIS
jgi:UDP-N-acetylmuramate--alanine ligase